VTLADVPTDSKPTGNKTDKIGGGRRLRRQRITKPAAFTANGWNYNEYFIT
jgi:hypothetical protein